MRRGIIVVVGLLGLLPGESVLSQPGGMEAAGATSPLPQSLDKLYPPGAEGPVWLLTMFGLGTTFSGVVSDFMEGDFANAERGYADLQLQYGKLSQMVPEWAGELPREPIEALGTALRSRDPAKFMPAVDHASMVCHGCHVENMARVQQKYHWGDFGVIGLTDPVSKQDVPFRVFMQMLDSDFSGVQVDLAQGQLDQARQHVAGLAKRYAILKDACGACHDSERSYYVDSSVTGMIDTLGKALEGDAVDPGSVRQLMQGIGMESCHKCHLVHAPSAMARYSMEAAKH